MSDNNQNKHIHNTDDQDTICFTPPEQERQQQYQRQQKYADPRQYQGQQQYADPRQYQGQQQYADPRQYQGQQQYTDPRQYQGQQQYADPRQYQGQQQYADPRQYQGQQQYTDPRQYQGQQQYADPRQYQGKQQYTDPRQYQGQQYQGGYYPPPYSAPPQKKKKKKKSPQVQAPAPIIIKEPKVKKKKHKKSLLRKIITRVLLSLLSIFLLLFGIYSCTSLSLISKTNRVPTGERSRTSSAISKNYVKSVLIIGTDGRTEDDRGRSDSMILVSLNRKTNKLYMTSFMRDCYVDIPGYGQDKLNAAYSFGGPELLMDTIEKNFRVKIDDYIQVNFGTFASVIDAAGGIDMEISDAEAESINTILISEVNELMGDERESDLLEHGGNVHLNGKQALAYSRIRNVGNYDFERTNRQRKVITELIKKARSGGLSFVKNVSKNALPSITTNMSTGELYLLSLRLPFVLKYDTEQLQIPAEGTFTDDPYNDKGWVIEVDFDANRELLEDTVFSRK